MSLDSSSAYSADKQFEGQLQTNATNLLINKQTNDSNLNLAKQQNQWNLEQWNRENSYNSPAQQLKRLQEAGLNPALVDVGSSTANQLTSSPLANQQSTQLTNPYEGAAQYGIQKQQNLVQAFATANDTIKQMQDYYLNLNRLGMDKDLLPYQKELVTQQASQFASSALLNNGQSKYQKELLEADIYNKWKTGKLTEEQAKTQSAIRKPQIENLEASTENTKASTEKTKADTKFVNIQARWYEPKVQAEISKLYTAANLDKATSNTANQVLPLLLEGHSLQNEQIKLLNELNPLEKSKLGAIIHSLELDNKFKQVNIDQAQFNLDFDKEHKEAYYYMDYNKSLGQAGKDLVDILTSPARFIPFANGGH